MALSEIGMLRARPNGVRGPDERSSEFGIAPPLEVGLDVALERGLGAPLARASMAARILVHHLSDTDERGARSILDAVEGVEGALADVLELLRSSARPRESRASWRRTDLRRLSERVVDAIQVRYPHYGLNLETDARVEGTWDPDAVASMISRLVLNAVHHGSTEGFIRIRVHGLDDRAVFEIRSAGKLPTDVPAHRLFEPFVCARPRRSDGVCGLGLGLCLASRVARSHGGRIECRSTGRDDTTFRASLPRW